MERQVLSLGHVPEVPVDICAQTGERDVFDIHRDRAGFDFGKIQDVIDQVQEIGTGGVNVARKFHLLAGEVAGGVFRKLLAEDENRIERRPQFVGHVRQEFRLVF